MKHGKTTELNSQDRVFYLSAIFNACLNGDELRRCMGIINSQKSLWKNSSKIISFFIKKSNKVPVIKNAEQCIFYRYDFIDDGELVNGDAVNDFLNRDLLIFNLTSGEIYSCWHEGGVYLNVNKADELSRKRPAS